MKFVIVLVFCFAACYAAILQQKGEAARPGDLSYEQIFIDTARRTAASPKTWKVGYNTYFAGRKLSDIKRIMGTKMGRSTNAPTVVHQVEKDLPASFDGRQTWSFCNNISSIRDQANCGSCWAEAVTEVATDRICIQSKGAKQKVISVEDLMSCCAHCVDTEGCQGGYPDRAMEYWVKTGIVTGGNWGSDRGCQPYEIEPCGPWHPCTGLAPTPKCQQSCEPDYHTPYTKDYQFGSSHYSVASNEAQIRQEIYTNGPVSAAFDVYRDFLSYTSGVYHHVTGDLLGGHAVKIFGWGTEDSTPFWWAANSWNKTWGDNGFFKIARGTDECGIEDYIVAGMAKL